MATVKKDKPPSDLFPSSSFYCGRIIIARGHDYVLWLVVDTAGLNRTRDRLTRVLYAHSITGCELAHVQSSFPVTGIRVKQAQASPAQFLVRSPSSVLLELKDEFPEKRFLSSSRSGAVTKCQLFANSFGFNSVQ